mmetsp:Transcript_3782/g.5943  ORF Transcript_3782/g.5943 Transcript_3782/m.5943 type:complete len:109 (+) Transcript_3782:826-1152(+)
MSDSLARQLANNKSPTTVSSRMWVVAMNALINSVKVCRKIQNSKNFLNDVTHVVLMNDRSWWYFCKKTMTLIANNTMSSVIDRRVSTVQAQDCLLKSYHRIACLPSLP